MSHFDTVNDVCRFVLMSLYSQNMKRR